MRPQPLYYFEIPMRQLVVADREAVMRDIAAQARGMAAADGAIIEEMHTEQILDRESYRVVFSGHRLVHVSVAAERWAMMSEAGEHATPVAPRRAISLGGI